MKGTSLAATWPMRLIPPMMTTATRAATMGAETYLLTWKLASSTLLTFQPWNMLPLPKEFSTVARAKATASTRKSTHKPLPRFRSGSTRA